MIVKLKLVVHKVRKIIMDIYYRETTCNGENINYSWPITITVSSYTLLITITTRMVQLPATAAIEYVAACCRTRTRTRTKTKTRTTTKIGTITKIVRGTYGRKERGRQRGGEGQ